MAAAVQRAPASEHKTSLPVYHQVPETKHELEWADLVTLDLSKFDRPGGKEALAKQLFDAIQNIGFFYIVNFGLSQEEVDRQFAIGKSVFELPTEEKLKYRADLENGGYNGYKPLGLREVRPGVFDNTEIFNIPKFIPAFERPQPNVIDENKEEIEHFARHIHNNIVQKLLTLFAIILELPEDYFAGRHRYDEALSDCHLRYMKYHARDAETNAKLENVWVKGHTDFGSLTLLFRQPVAALQVRGSDGSWKWVKPYDGSITVNVADALEFLTNGFLKSSIHRVVVPPPDQAGIDRLGVLYFVRPEDSLELRPVQSKVLERLGYDSNVNSELAGITAGEWVKARVRAGVNKNKQARSEISEQEIVKGVKAKYYD
ncbi:putative 2-oxoglutarate-dependent dioxygenase JRG21 [Colletotrichum gloeosporioides]|uniref:Putative 2-oxoglutarate-dependent dioxygenase JRG21 n=1 Tax=Colletotrichum gloeosporioides TaxID=474922 RepID=A0A8H4CIT8_COLGL|nr:putative 2-oxoglutarate-dependent dioxygenase JRG21 [Colletotrichum gloeosporioides]KAF3804743.1 putative 2-oxoglutarate-dependent dioxygenase JRG21 [Colletotrichum gloeosporioides]